MTAVMALRAAVHNLCTIPVKELTSTAEYIATTISESSAILSVPANQGQSAGEPDKAVLLQKLKARITSLLQDKTVEGRWAGVVIMKATVESGRWEILRGCEPWARHILAILGVCLIKSCCLRQTLKTREMLTNICTDRNRTHCR